jgi:hypothetical protein
MAWIRSVPLETAALLAAVVSSCARQPKRGEPLPQVVSTEAPMQVSTAMDSVTALPLAPSLRASTLTGVTVTLREGPGKLDSLRAPPLYVVDGVILGRRRDGTIDRAAAQDALKTLDPKLISSIEVIKGEPAIERFGRGASGGAVLITMVRPAATQEERRP